MRNAIQMKDGISSYRSQDLFEHENYEIHPILFDEDLHVELEGKRIFPKLH